MSPSISGHGSGAHDPTTDPTDAPPPGRQGSDLAAASVDPEFLDGAGRDLLDTLLDGTVGGGPGSDRLVLREGDYTARGRDGDDRIVAEGVGRSVLDGGAGDDVIRLLSAAPHSILLGGDGDDRIRADAPGSLIYGGEGDDRYVLRGDTAGGAVIVDSEGRNRLRIDTDGPIGFSRVEGSDDLRILLGGDGTYDRARDVVWADFFANPSNRVNDLRTAEVAALAVAEPSPPPPPTTVPTLAEFINAANWAYARDEGNIPAGLRPLEVDGEHLAREVTDSGFYGAAFLTPDDQVIVAFEGTHLSALDDDPEFVLAQVAADLQLYLGLVPTAFSDTYAFTLAALTAAEGQGIAADDVFVTGHSLGAGEAAYAAATFGLAGQTFAAPGIPAGVIPAGRVSELTNFVERGDPVGNYSANPNYLGDFLYSDQILRFGDATYIGNPLARLALEAAGALFGPGTTPQRNAEGLGLLAGLAAEYHVLTTYAEDLGVTLDDPDAYGGIGLDAAGLLAAVRALLAGGGATAEPGVA